MLRCVRVSSGPTVSLTETVKVFQGELEDFQEHARCLQVFTMSREIPSPMCSRRTRPQTGCVHDIDVAAVVKLDTVIDISNLTLTRSHTHLLMEFGHFLAHDISLTSQAELDCCSPEVGVGTMMIKIYMRITMAIACGEDEEAEQ